VGPLERHLGTLKPKLAETILALVVAPDASIARLQGAPGPSAVVPPRGAHVADD